MKNKMRTPNPEPHLSTVILRTLVGSTVHGLCVAQQDDRDEMGICVEPLQHLLGLRERFEQYEFRTQPKGHRSGPGDLDLVIYGLAKWARLALQGNPTILLPLYAPDSAILHIDERGRALRRMADQFISDDTLDRFIGYMREQRYRMRDRVRQPRRPELIEQFGYDTKYAGHVIRLGNQGIEIGLTGRLTLPMSDPVRQRILDIRTGRVSEADVLAEAEDLETKLLLIRETSPFGPPRTQPIEQFVTQLYVEQCRLP